MSVSRTQCLQDQMDYIMDTFDIQKCLRFMEDNEIDWALNQSNPEYYVRRAMRECLRGAIQHGYSSIGGFQFWLEEGEDNFVAIRGGYYIETVGDAYAENQQEDYCYYDHDDTVTFDTIEITENDDGDIKYVWSNTQWKPEVGDLFYFIDSAFQIANIEYIEDYSDDFVKDLTHVGNCFRNYEEANMVAKKLKEVLIDFRVSCLSV